MALDTISALGLISFLCMFPSSAVLHISKKKVTENSGKMFWNSKTFLSSFHLSTDH